MMRSLGDTLLTIHPGDFQGKSLGRIWVPVREGIEERTRSE